MQKVKGSITIFSLLSLLLVTATIFALLEGTRYQELHRFAKLQTELALESAFASYNTCLWENYRLLGVDKTLAYEEIKQASDGRNSRGANLLRLQPHEIEMKSYQYITDEDGSVFIDSVSNYMTENFLYEAGKELYNQYEAIKYLMDSSQMEETDIGEALKEIQNATQQNIPKSIGTAAQKNESKKLDVVGILEMAKSWQEQGILKLVVEDTDKLSKTQHDFQDGLLERKLDEGNMSMENETDWKDRILLQQYLLTYLSDFRDVKKERALSYELEYLLGEKPSDMENLKIVVSKILAIREAANFLYLVSNPEKIAQVEALATIIGGMSANPVVYEVVKIGVLTAWALAESILDVRALLAGRRVALLKSEETWTAELENLGEITKGFAMAKECNWGLSYENYLSILLLFEDSTNLAMRTMNLQEATIRNVYQDMSFRMDALVVQAEITVSYTYSPVFPFLQTLGANRQWEYEITGTQPYGYYRKAGIKG